MEHFGDLGATDHVLDPTCGPGNFLAAVPVHIPATGIEIDPRMAQVAIQETGRRVIVGDAACVDLDFKPTAIIGNPPFRAAIIDRLIERFHAWLPEGGRVGMILPAYYLGRQPERLLQQSEMWSIRQQLLPQCLFAKLSVPLTFCLYERTKSGVMVGFALYREISEIRMLERRYRKVLNGTGSVWAKAVATALRRLGGRARVGEIYRELSQHPRPTNNPWWQEKVRQILQLHFQRVERGVWELPCSARITA
jgi:site-specific DNA-methyltransferase (adenine-specific)